MMRRASQNRRTSWSPERSVRFLDGTSSRAGLIGFVCGALLMQFMHTNTVSSPKPSVAAPQLVPNREARGFSETVIDQPFPNVLSGDTAPDIGAHSATGDHLIVDMYNADQALLNDEKRLTEASIAIAESANMHILSVRSHKLSPQGVSVTVTLAESHLTIHTWPEFGTALVDLFTCGGGDLHAVLPTVVRHYGGSVKDAKWSIVPRGAPGISDMNKYVRSRLHVDKEVVYSSKSKYQKIDVWKVKSNITSEGSVKMLYLDEVLQSSTGDEKAYHESLVQPAMLAHGTGAKRVAILGGGEGATLREVLSHRSVKEAVMVELDGDVVQVARDHLHTYHNCSFVPNNESKVQFQSCFDDPRAKVVVDDAVGWFHRTFNGDACDDQKSSERFDVIVMDLLDPELIPDSDFAKLLYSAQMMKDLSCALTPDGVLVTQFGRSLVFGEDATPLLFKQDIIKNMTKQFPAGIYPYDVYFPSFDGTWEFVVGCKSHTCASNWNQSLNRTENLIKSRLFPRKNLKFINQMVLESLHAGPRWDTQQMLQ